MSRIQIEHKLLAIYLNGERTAQQILSLILSLYLLQNWIAIQKLFDP